MGRGSSDTEEESRAREKRNTGGAPLQAALQTAGQTAARRAGGGRGPTQDPGLETASLARILMREDSGADQAAALLMAPEGRGKPYRVQRSRSKSRTRRSRSRPRPRSRCRSSERASHRRNRSRSRDRDRHKIQDKEKREKEKDEGKDKEVHSIKHRDSGNIKAGLEHLPPAEHAKARLQLVLEAAAKADEALIAKERSEEEAKRRKEEDQATLVEQVKKE